MTPKQGTDYGTNPNLRDNKGTRLVYNRREIRDRTSVTNVLSLINFNECTGEWRRVMSIGIDSYTHVCLGFSPRFLFMYLLLLFPWFLFTNIEPENGRGKMANP